MKQNTTYPTTTHKNILNDTALKGRDMKVNKLGNLVDMGPKNESFRIPKLMCLSVTFISIKQDSGFAASCNGGIHRPSILKSFYSS